MTTSNDASIGTFFAFFPLFHVFHDEQRATRNAQRDPRPGPPRPIGDPARRPAAARRPGPPTPAYFSLFAFCVAVDFACPCSLCNWLWCCSQSQTTDIGWS